MKDERKSDFQLQMEEMIERMGPVGFTVAAASALLALIFVVGSYFTR